MPFAPSESRGDSSAAFISFAAADLDILANNAAPRPQQVEDCFDQRRRLTCGAWAPSSMHEWRLIAAASTSACKRPCSLPQFLEPRLGAASLVLGEDKSSGFVLCAWSGSAEALNGTSR